MSRITTQSFIMPCFFFFFCLVAHIQSWENIANWTPNLLMSHHFFYSIRHAWGWFVISFWHCIWVGEWAGYLQQAPHEGLLPTSTSCRVVGFFHDIDSSFRSMHKRTGQLNHVSLWLFLSVSCLLLVQLNVVHFICHFNNVDRMARVLTNKLSW